jgi:hypothetical protein
MILPDDEAGVMHERRRVMTFPSLMSANMPTVIVMTAREASFNGIISLTFTT